MGSLMRSRIAALLVALALVGCTSGPQAPKQEATFISAIGTPFLIALKIPACAGSIAIAGPLAGASQLAESSSLIDEFDLRRNLNDGLNRNCGPPYVVSP